MRFEVASVEEAGLEAIYVHQPDNQVASQLLAELKLPETPVPIGVIHQKERLAYDQAMSQQIEHARRNF